MPWARERQRCMVVFVDGAPAKTMVLQLIITYHFLMTEEPRSKAFDRRTKIHDPHEPVPFVFRTRGSQGTVFGIFLLGESSGPMFWRKELRLEVAGKNGARAIVSKHGRNLVRQSTNLPLRGTPH